MTQGLPRLPLENLKTRWNLARMLSVLAPSQAPGWLVVTWHPLKWNSFDKLKHSMPPTYQSRPNPHNSTTYSKCRNSKPKYPLPRSSRWSTRVKNSPQQPRFSSQPQISSDHSKTLCTHSTQLRSVQCQQECIGFHVASTDRSIACAASFGAVIHRVGFMSGSCWN